MQIKINLVIGLLLFFGQNYAQLQRLVINNNGYVNIEGSGHLVISNPNSNAITLLGTGANIISESEHDVVNWKVGTNTGAYTIPFTTGTGVKIPLTINVNSAGTGLGTILVSTHTDTDGVDSWNNSDYLPTEVSNMFGVNGSVNNSAYVIDRFWNINAQNYTTKPTGIISFGYNDAERSQAGNTIATGTLKAQYYNTTNNRWVYPSIGTDGFPTTNVTGVPTTNEFFKTWTLSEVNNPLPVELLNFTAIEKQEEYVQLDWTTVSEINNDYFSVQKSIDGINWQEINQVQGAGNSSQTIEYTLNDYNPFIGTSYYRLEQFDFNGDSEYSDLEAVNFKGVENIIIYPNPTNQSSFNIKANSFINEDLTISIYDSQGRIVYNKINEINKGSNSLSISIAHLSKGVYYVHLSGVNRLLYTQNELIIQ